MDSFKTKQKQVKILAVIIIIILISVVVGYYVAHREDEKVQTPPLENKRDKDSVSHVNPEVIPAEMGAKPEINLKDGSIKIVEEFIKLNAKNPATFKFQEWSEVSIEGGYWKVRCKYSGVSSFNAEVTTNAWFYIKKNKVVYTKIISKI